MKKEVKYEFPVYVTFKKFIYTYRNFIMFARQFEKDWLNEKFNIIIKATTESAEGLLKKYQEREKYCNDFITKNNKREEEFDKILFDIEAREYDIDGNLAVEIKNEAELFTLFCGNVQREIELSQQYNNGLILIR